MKQILWCLLLVSASCYSQTNQSGKPGSDYDGVAGSPYLLKDWVNGTVYYRNGRVVTQFKLRFDCPRNFLQMEFKGQTFSPQISSITSFVLYPKNSKDSMIFRKGYPASGSYNAETFYQVLMPGKASLLYILSKTIVEDKDILPSSTKRFFEEEDEFFLFSNGAITKLIKNDREKLAAQFPAQKEALLQFMNDSAMKMKSAEDFMKFTTKYNELDQ
ncbi:hypothetical protein [Pseudoflavitalea rhizosphaerae]|uniref:hypothetical protein n=1 Tax=Pseudoflavitalea rhizosphaerae TaxID=1884793 RepID=UPI000F8EE0A6|nr:hypothetical protein [Pseudoflavitalea rhizosphaerae]